jgi:nascent polypeptide-associated complex subunit alpha
MSAPKDSNPRVEEVEDDDEAPDLLANAEGDRLDAANVPGGKGSKRYAKAMAKLGLKQELGVFKVLLKKSGQVVAALQKTEVYRFPNTSTFVIFGEPATDDAVAMPGAAGADAARAASAVTGGSAAPAAAAASAAGGAAAADDGDEDIGDLDPKQVKLVCDQANCSRSRAIKALKANNGDIVNTIMELTM